MHRLGVLFRSQGDHLLVNWNQTLTFNSNVTITTTTGDKTLQINGPNALVVFNGQFRNPNANWSLYAQEDGEFRINATQYNLNKILKLKKGYLVVKGDVYGAVDDANQAISFQGDWGASPKVIVFDASGAQTISNRVILHRGQAGNYHEVRFKTKNVNLISKPRLVQNTVHWNFWNVDQGSYVKVPGFSVSASGLTMCFGGGGTTDVVAANENANTFNVILSNGVFLANNPSGNAVNGPVTVCAGAVLGGAGTLSSTITNLSGGIVSPGNSIGTLTTAGNAVFAAGGILNWEVNGATADKLSVNALDISAGAVTVKVVNAGSIQIGVTNDAFAFTTLNGNAANDLVVDVSGVPGITANIIAGTGSIGIQLVPEPGLIGLGLLALVGMRRK